MTFRHRAGVRPYTSSKEFAESCVFVKQSIPPGFCPRIQLMAASATHLLSGSLLPKLQEYVAEFLNWSSLTRLRILSPPTCVGFRYESTPSSHPPIFLCVENVSLPGTLLPTHSLLGDNCEADLPTSRPYEVRPPQPMGGRNSLPQS